jgi:ATP-dependent Clp protease ATP-binding subunit ClpC
LNEKEINKIVGLEIDKLKERMEELGYKLRLTKSIRDYLVEVGYEEEYGARPLNRAIQKYVEDPISEEVLKGNVKEGETIILTYSKSKQKVEVRVAE